jgi:hypothetical protein
MRVAGVARQNRPWGARTTAAFLPFDRDEPLQAV